MIPKPGDLVEVEPNMQRGTVVGVTQFVTGDGRYVSVKFDDDSVQLFHESRVKKTNT